MEENQKQDELEIFDKIQENYEQEAAEQSFDESALFDDFDE